MSADQRTIDIRVAEVCEARDAKTGNSYSMYRIDCYAPATGLIVASTWRRYQEFVALNGQLLASHLPLLNLPPKKRFGSVDVEERRVGLQQALQTRCTNVRLLPEAFAKFLTVDGLDPSALEPVPEAREAAEPFLSPHTSESEEKLRPSTGDAVSTATSNEQSPPSNRTDGLMQASNALTSTIATAEQTVADQWWQRQLTKVAAALLVLALSMRRSHKSSRRSLSTLLLSACSGLWIGLLAPRRDAVRRAAAVKAVKAKAQELGAEVLAIVPDQGSNMTLSKMREKLERPMSPSSTAAASTAADLEPSSVSGSCSSSPAAEPLPQLLKQKADKMCELLLQNMGSDVNAYGLPWEVVKSVDGLEISSSKVPNQARKCWRSRFTLTSSASRDQIIEETMTWEKRLKWDRTFMRGVVLNSFAGGYDISHYCSASVLGISSREFVNLRCIRHLPDEGIIHAFSSMMPEDNVPGLPPPSQGCVRAEANRGTGVRWTKVPSDGSDASRWAVEVIADVDPKGWIPSSLINRAMTMSFTDNYVQMSKHFSTIRPGEST